MRLEGIIMKFCISVLFVALATSLPAYAERSENWSISASAGTSGGTLETTYRFTDHFHLRGGMNTITVSANIDDSDISYDGDLEFKGGSAFVDVYPLDLPVFLTAGLYAGRQAIDLTATSSQSFDIYGMTMTPVEYGYLQGEASYGDYAPFLGFGYNSTFFTDNSFGLHALMGVAYFGEADVSLRSVGGTYSESEYIQQLVENERQSLEEELADYEFYPILQLGLSRRF
ncbi:MAG: hypothetical protein CBB65_13625 [Hyphomonadaceae bacterium TMED5]|nr:hypothetical protein [Ponticaulis sp.]OUX97831.1 MAG: hypothetical protein CBB65_13625 [Hyphomonadaceae bacterium TMED5]